jgi:hypothetical protein
VPTHKIFDGVIVTPLRVAKMPNGTAKLLFEARMAVLDFGGQLFRVKQGQNGMIERVRTNGTRLGSIEASSVQFIGSNSSHCSGLGRKLGVASRRVSSACSLLASGSPFNHPIVAATSVALRPSLALSETLCSLERYRSRSRTSLVQSHWPVSMRFGQTKKVAGTASRCSTG